MNKNTRKYFTWISAILVVAGLIVLCIEGIRMSAAAEPQAEAPAGSYKLISDNLIQADLDAVKAAGIQTFTVQPRDVPITLTLTGRTGLDMDSVTHVHAQFGGKVKEIKPELGDQVNGPEAPGGATVLCVIESNDLAQAKSNYLQAKVQLKLDDDNLDRTRELVKSTVLADKFLLDAEAAVRKDAALLEAARQQLLVFGLTQNDIEQIDTQEGRQRMDYIITSPRTGVVAEKGVSGGEVADPTVNLFTIADMSTMWVWGDVYERDLRRIKVGDPMKIVFTSDPDRPRNCTLDWISPVLDPNTHSIRVRGSLDNKDGRLLADMYGTMIVTVDPGAASIVVPAESVVRKGTEAFVFEQLPGNGSAIQFREIPVKIEPVDIGFGVSDSAAAASSAGRDISRTGTDDPLGRPIRIVEGLQPGQTIVRDGALGLFNEMMQQANQ